MVAGTKRGVRERAFASDETINFPPWTYGMAWDGLTNGSTITPTKNKKSEKKKKNTFKMGRGVSS